MFLEDFINLLYFLTWVWVGFLWISSSCRSKYISASFCSFLGIALLKRAQMYCWFRASTQCLVCHPLIIRRNTACFPTSQAPFPHGKHEGRSNRLNISIILRANRLGKFIKLFSASTEKLEEELRDPVWCECRGVGSAQRVLGSRQQRVLGSRPSGFSTPNFSHWKWDDVSLWSNWIRTGSTRRSWSHLKHLYWWVVVCHSILLNFM